MGDQDTLTALTGTASAVSGVLRGAGAMDLRVPHLEWTVGEVAEHLVSIVRAYTAAEEGSGPVGPDFTKVPENNARLLAATAEGNPAALAGALEASTAAFVATNQQLPRDQRVPFYGDLTITAAGAAAVMLFELLVHGWDISTGLGKKSSIDPNSARLALGMFPEVLPNLVKSDSVKGATATYEIRIRGAQPYFLVFDDGALTVSSTPGTRHVDCRISAEPSAYLLVSTGRVSRWWPTISGKIFASGRRPWLALGFEKMFASP